MKMKRILSFLLTISLLCGNVSPAFAAENNFLAAYGNKAERVVSDEQNLSEERKVNLERTETEAEDKEEGETETEFMVSDNDINEENNEIVSDNETMENDGEKISENEIDEEDNEIISDDDIKGENSETLSDNDVLDGKQESLSENDIVLLENSSSEPYALNLEVTLQEYGKVTLYWEMGNKPAGSTAYRYANVYRSSSENGEYILIGENVPCYFNEDDYEYIDTDVRSEGTENATYYYKVCILNDDGTEGVFTETATNADIYYGSGIDTDYVGAYIGDAEGNKLNSLTITEGQTLELTIVLVKKDGTAEIVSSDDISEGSWYLYDQYYTTEEFNNISYSGEGRLDSSIMKFLPVKWDTEISWGHESWEPIDYRLYLQAQEGAAKQEPYYIMLDANGVTDTEIETGRWHWQIPVYVEEAQGTETFENHDGENGVMYSLESFYSAARKDMVNRVETAVYYVEESVYEEFFDISDEYFDSELLDFDREREGMKPYEGDYLRWQNFPSDSVSDIYTRWTFEQGGNFHGSYWMMITSNQPFFTTRAQEDQVDAKIEEIVWTEEGELYSYHNASEYEIIKACYDYVRKHVTYIGTPTPSYHSCWSALIKGKGTCQAYSLLYGRLLREFGIANKLIMGTDKNAHTYNIVEIDGVWYYSDPTSSTFGLYGESNFSRTEYQEMFFDEEFQANYIKKISAMDYVPDSVYLYGNGKKIDGCSSLQSAVTIMKEHAAQNPGVTYSIKLANDAALTGTEFSDLTGVFSCEVDLGGHTLTINAENSIPIDGLKNGKLELGKAVNLALFSRDVSEDGLVLENLIIHAASNTVGVITIGKVETEQEITGGQKGVILDKVTISNAYQVNFYGNITSDETKITAENLILDSKDNSTYHEVKGSITSKGLEVLEGKWKLEELSVTDIINNGLVEIQNLKKVLNIENKSDAGMILNQIIQTSKGKVWLETDSVLICNQDAVLYNIVTGGKESTEGGNAYFYKAPNAKISLEGNVSRSAENAMLYFGVLDTEAAQDADSVKNIEERELAAGECLFTTKIKKFPVSLILVKQSAENERKIVVYQQGQEILAGKENIILLESDDSGQETELGRFVRWSDAVTYLKSTSNVSKDYIVEIPENTELKESLTMPAKVKSITFRSGLKDDSNIQLSYLGDIKLSAGTAFENIDLKAVKYNSKKKDYEEYYSAVNLNGKSLKIINGTALFASITGNKNAELILNNTEIQMKKSVTSLGFMDLKDSKLRAENVTVTNTLSMQSSEINCSGKLSLKDIRSLDEKNIIAYGGNTSKNILNITGNITSDEQKNESVNVGRTENGEDITKTATIHKNAITLKIASLENESESGYKTGILLCNAQKAGAAWFVVGSEWGQEGSESRTIAYAAYKKGKAVYCGEAEDIVRLYSSHSGQQEDFVYEGGFSTLQDALSEIDKLAVKTNYYRIELGDVQKDLVTFSNKNLTFPSKTSGITIAAGDNLTEAVIYLKDKIALKSNIVFEDIIFAPAKDIKFELGNFGMTLMRCSSYDAQTGSQFSVNENGERVVRAASVNGSGTAKNSKLVLSDTALLAAGAVKNIGKLVYTGEQAESVIPYNTRLGSIPLYSKLEANGAVQVGGIELETEGTLTGLATVKRSKDKKTITGITSQITIAKDVVSGQGKVLYLDLREKQGKSYIQLKLDGGDSKAICQTGFSLAKGVNVTYSNIQAAQLAGKNLVKKSGNLTYYEEEYGIELSYMESDKEITVPCVSFADAVTEINNKKVKRDYVITLLPANADISSSSPKALTMPNKKYVNSLVIQAESGAEEAQLYYLNQITFTSHVTLKDIAFIQMIKSGSVYLDADEVKKGYPAAVTVNTGGFDLQIEEEVTFNTPLLMKGGNKGTLTLTADGTLNTQTNDFSEINPEAENIVYGMITDFKTVNMNGCNLELIEYETAYGSKKYKSVNMKVTDWNLIDGDVTVKDRNGKASFKVTNLCVENGNVAVGGKINLTNAVINGSANTVIQSDKDFNITGTLTSFNDNAILLTRLKGAGKAPYLNVSGKVVRGDDINPVYVGVYPELTAKNPEKAVVLTGAPKVTGQLLTAKKALAEDFRPIDENYTAGSGEYSPENPTGYIVVKSGSNIYVYEGSKY